MMKVRNVSANSGSSRASSARRRSREIWLFSRCGSTASSPYFAFNRPTCCVHLNLSASKFMIAASRLSMLALRSNNWSCGPFPAACSLVTSIAYLRPQIRLAAPAELPGVLLKHVIEGPRRLLDARAGVAVGLTNTVLRALVVPLDRPDGHEVHVHLLLERHHRLGVINGRRLVFAEVRYAGQHRHGFHPPDPPRAQMRIQPGQLGMHGIRALDGGAAHVHDALVRQVVVEHHDVDRMH